MQVENSKRSQESRCGLARTARAGTCACVALAVLGFVFVSRSSPAPVASVDATVPVNSASTTPQISREEPRDPDHTRTTSPTTDDQGSASCPWGDWTLDCAKAEISAEPPSGGLAPPSVPDGAAQVNGATYAPTPTTVPAPAPVPWPSMAWLLRLALCESGYPYTGPENRWRTGYFGIEAAYPIGDLSWDEQVAWVVEILHAYGIRAWGAYPGCVGAPY